MDRQMYVYRHVHIPRSRHTATPGRPMRKKQNIYIYIYMIHESTLTKFKKFFLTTSCCRALAFARIISSELPALNLKVEPKH